MGKIRLLADDLINRIAAGEVVERPASVVKELLENSLDAGCRSIEVRLAGGGRQRITVIDDGSGMDRDDALLALERHATSKLRSVADLETLATLGFRGEALSSIAAVSILRLQTALADGDGTEVEVRGGKITNVRRTGLGQGTAVHVDRLFFNVPARRKFLRSEETELAHVLRWLTRYALAHPQLRFLLDHGERRLLDTPPAAERLERIAQIYGRDLARTLLPFESVRGSIAARGWAGRPVAALPRRDAQHLFVNGRAIQDRVLAHAVAEAYSNTMPAGRYPSVFLFLELPAGAVDVNVHPQKTEVRFRNSGEIHDQVRDAVASALAARAVVPTLAALRPRAASPAGQRADALEIEARPTTPPPVTEHLAEPTRPYTIPAELERPARAVPLGQLQDSYIVAEDAEGLVLVDQHAAHERVLFERYLAEAEDNQVEKQRLLFPVSFDLAPHERLILAEEAPEFARLGFEVEPFGGSAVRVDTVPSVAATLEPEMLLRELLGEAARSRSAAAGVASLRRRLVTSAACQAAIKIHHPLSRPAMQGLLDDLYATVSPSTCPHGRPVLFRLTLQEIERAFRRR